MAKKKIDYRVGISGWKYPSWRGRFYPKGLAQTRELEYASRHFRSIEVNGSFYSLLTQESYRRWYGETPEDFVFAVKGNQYVTHVLRLQDPVPPLSVFFSSGVLALKEKLGPVLWQFPPSLRYDRECVENFLIALPRTFEAAAKLARKRGVVAMRGRIRHAIEVRHPSFENPEFFELLRQYDIALVIADTAGKWPYLSEITSDFLYVRLHGDRKLYSGGYSPSAIAMWERRIRKWSREVDRAFIYFDNTVEMHAPDDAKALANRLGYRLKSETWPPSFRRNPIKGPEIFIPRR